MAIYVYKGYNSDNGSACKGKVEADSVRSAKSILRQKHKVIVSEIKEEVDVSGKKSSLNITIGSGVSQQDLAIMTRQFAVLQKAQVPLDASLRALTQQSSNVVLSNTLSAVREKISEGQSLADATGAFPKVFSKLYINMIRAGESSGKLDLVLSRLADFIESQIAMKGKIISAMTYPMLMMVASSGIIVLLFVMVIPKLVKVFNNMKVTIPWYTNLCIKLSEIIQNYWYLILLTIGLITYAFIKWKKSPKGRMKFDSMALKAPLFGPIVMRLSVSQFTKTLSTLLSSGVPIINALDITKNVISNSIISGIVDQSKTSVQEGQNLSTTLDRSHIFPPLVTSMIKTGEKTGQLEEMLSNVAIAYDAEVDRKISSLIAAIEPLMTIMMTGVIVVVLFALLVPMMSIMGQMR